MINNLNHKRLILIFFLLISCLASFGHKRVVYAAANDLDCEQIYIETQSKGVYRNGVYTMPVFTGGERIKVVAKGSTSTTDISLYWIVVNQYRRDIGNYSIRFAVKTKGESCPVRRP